MLLQVNSDNVSEHKKKSIATYWHHTYVCTNSLCTTHPLTTPPTNHLPPTSHQHHYSGILSPFYERQVARAVGQPAFQTSTLDKWEGTASFKKNLLRCPSTKLRLAETTHADVPMFIFCIWSFPCANQQCQFVLWTLSSDPHPSI